MNRQITKRKCQKTGLRTYRISFGGDDYLHTVSFRSAMNCLEINRLLTAAGSSLYENIPETVRQCLDSSCPGYSDFVSGIFHLRHEEVMAFADCLLDSSPCDILDRLA